MYSCTSKCRIFYVFIILSCECHFQFANYLLIEWNYIVQITTAEKHCIQFIAIPTKTTHKIKLNLVIKNSNKRVNNLSTPKIKEIAVKGSCLHLR
ncbi:hypothetical protein AQUCO_00300018v1 [Aquilegia coerulea]|uniref:Uncharacterized protein n=1 Tax=Aquilegia coerulea TaxID=218851 RepID=A0A2G5EWW2_AQUCA|nr:hypothetical protein AQUCO_00300018v1 [Aquilegia coerulea]